MTATPNYGTQLTIAGITGMHVISVEAPLTKIGVIETTYHGSGSWRQHITDGLMGMESFKVSIEASGVIVADAFSIFEAGAAVACTFTENGMPTWSFDAILLTFDLGKADAQKPEEEILTITLQPTGDLAMAPAAGAFDDGVTALYLNTGAFAMLNSATFQLHVYAVVGGSSFEVLGTNLTTGITFDDANAYSSTSTSGLITAGADGAAIVTVSLVSDPTISVTLPITVS